MIELTGAEQVYTVRCAPSLWQDVYGGSNPNGFKSTLKQNGVWVISFGGGNNSKKPSDVLLSESQAAQLSLYTPKPHYPLEARRKQITGRGVFQLYVDVSTGLVRSIQVLQSTGSGILD